MKPCTFHPILKKQKNPPRERFSEESFSYISGNKNHEKNFLCFLKSKLFLYFGKQKQRKKFLIFHETEPFFIIGKEYLEAWHNETLLILQ